MKKQIPLQSQQWTHLDRQVQVATGKSSIKLVGAYRFEQPINIDSKLKNSHGKQRIWIDGTINVTDFSKQYYRQVLSNQVALEDLILYAGHVNIHKYTNQPYKIFTFLFCKIHLGTSGTASTPKVQNCDSIVISEESSEPFQYNFFVKQHWQYQVKYQVSFTVGDDKQFKINQYFCCNCQNKTPAIYCTTQNLYFCQQCCNDHHKPKLMHSHLLQSIDKINTLQNCKTHNQKFQLYCLKCQKYLCAVCTQKGIHAQGGSDHIVKSIRYYYSELNQNVETLPKKPLDKIQGLLHNLAIKRREIQQNQRQIRYQIQSQYKRCIKILDDEISKKYQMLDSTEIQLTLMKDKISWNQSFSVFQSSALKPIHYFKSQVIFEDQVRKLKIPDFDNVLSCKPDIVYEKFNLVGIQPVVERDLAARKQYQGEKKSQEVLLRKEEEARRSRQSLIKIQEQNIQKSKNLLTFDPQAESPFTNSSSSLLNQLIKCNLKFFQLKAQ